MRINPTAISPAILEAFPRIARSSALRQQIPAFQSTRLLPFNQHSQQQRRPYSAGTMSNDLFNQYKIDTPPTALNPRPGVDLNDSQKLILCSILDLFAGRPSKRKLTLWDDEASFHDPLTNAAGRKKYEAQWYGLKTAFSEIERLGCEVVSAGNPMEMKLKTRYKVKGIGSEQTIDSLIQVETMEGGGGMRIKKVFDKWDGSIEEGPVRKALRGLNAVSVPAMVR